MASRVVGEIVSSYPEYGYNNPANEAYVEEFTMAIVLFSREELELIVDRNIGIRSRCTFLPKISEVVKLVNEYRLKKVPFIAHILSAYHNSDTFSMDYLKGLHDHFETLRPEEILWVMDKNTGLVASCPNFPPSVGNMVEVVNKARERKNQFLPAPSSYSKFQPETFEKDGTPELRAEAIKRILEKKPERAPRVRPYPKLWEAFEQDEFLLLWRDFECLTLASKALAQHGKEAARDVLSRGKPTYEHTGTWSFGK